MLSLMNLLTINNASVVVVVVVVREKGLLGSADKVLLRENVFHLQNMLEAGGGRLRVTEACDNVTTRVIFRAPPLRNAHRHRRQMAVAQFRKTRLGN
ncbi:Arc-like DNA binding domain-containing protein [Anopheles sinensis]|uniref:Arc-like DNA binding domain-containing protein n=1 Tax=Anopheles sinensis TaxID=74873 RepID=A0A084VE65_ANOSI|nr:Arc-like DNA binding domain-containing protein [Anopheles sinensis]